MNLILACDTAKMLNHDLIRPSVSNQFYLRAKKDIYFVGLRAMLKKYFSEPITLEDIEEAEEVMIARGQLDKGKLYRWRKILDEWGGYLPVTIRAVPEGSFVKAGLPVLVVESYCMDSSWVPYVIDSIILRSIWYPSSLATRMMGIKKELESWCDEPEFVYDIANRCTPTEESAEIASSVAKMVFEKYDSIQGDLYLYKNYEYRMGSQYPTYLNEHNHIIGWTNEEDFYTRLNAVAPDSSVICLVDTYDTNECIKLLLCDSIQRLARSRNLSLYFLADSSKTTRELLTVYDQIKHTNVGLVKSNLTECAARSMAQLDFDSSRLLFMLEDSVLQDGLTRNTYGFEYKQCAVKREPSSSWEPVNKEPSSRPEMKTLRGLQFPHDSQTVYISGYQTELDDFQKIHDRLCRKGE